MSPADRERPHRRGERVTIRWPGGPYDFVVLFDHAETSTLPGWEGWLTVTGPCVEPAGPRRRSVRSFFVRRVAGAERTYALLPRREG